MNPELAALARIVDVVLEAIKAAGSQGIPDGQLYMMLQSTIGPRWSLNVHQQVIEALVVTGKITNTGHLLVAK